MGRRTGFEMDCRTGKEMGLPEKWVGELVRNGLENWARNGLENWARNGLQNWPRNGLKNWPRNGLNWSRNRLENWPRNWLENWPRMGWRMAKKWAGELAKYRESFARIVLSATFWEWLSTWRWGEWRWWYKREESNGDETSLGYTELTLVECVSSVVARVNSTEVRR